MKHFLASCRLFGRKKPVQIIGFASIPIYVVFCLFVMDYFNFLRYGRFTPILAFIKNRPLPFLFSVLVMLLLMTILLLLSKKVWVSSAILGLVALLMAYINYTKVAFNGENFLPRDILMVKNTQQLVSFVGEPMPIEFYLLAFLLLCVTVAYALADLALPLRWYIRLPSAVAIVAALFFLFLPAKRAEWILDNIFDLQYVDTILQPTNYCENGFVSAFVLNCFCLREQAPHAYSEEAIESLLLPYEETQTTGEEFDVIVVLNESFSDIRKLPGVTFSQNPLENYDRLVETEGSYSGSVYTTAVGGGTVRPEFDMLTGLSTDYMLPGASPWEKVSEPISSFVSNYKDSGYHTVAIHPYDPLFYSRYFAYPNVGFDAFYGLPVLEKMYGFDAENDYKRGYLKDSVTFEIIKDVLSKSEEPSFLFAITMQNHQAYNKLPDDEILVQVNSDNITGDALDALTTYTQGLYDADCMLGELAAYIDTCERPTILLFFGDHYPSLGSNFEAYNQSGFVDFSNGLDAEESLNIYATPFIIYANRPIEIAMFQSMRDNQMSAYHMLNAVALATGFHRTRYMNLLLDLYGETPYYNNRLLIETSDATDRLQNAMELITYDRISGNGYSNP